MQKTEIRPWEDQKHLVLWDKESEDHMDSDDEDTTESVQYTKNNENIEVEAQSNGSKEGEV